MRNIHVFFFIMLSLASIDLSAQVDRIELGYQTTRRGVVWYRPGLPTHAPTWKFSRDTNAVLWVDTLTAIRYDWDYSDDRWRAKGTFSGPLPPRPQQTSGAALVDNRTAFWIRDTFNLLHKYDSTANAWTPWGDWFYLSTVPTDITATGANGAAKYRRSLWQDADDFVVRYWNGTAWSIFAGTGTDLSYSGASSPVTINSSTGADVTITAGTGISLSATSGNLTITNTSTNTDAQNLTIEGSGPTYDVAISGGSDVTIAGGGIVALSEGPANTLIITATEADGSTTNELQTYGHAGTTTYTNTLSSGGGSFTLQAGTNVTLSHTSGTTTISAASGGDGNGIYGDGTAGSGDDSLPPGGSNVTVPNDNSPLDFLVNAGAGNPSPFLAIRVITDYCADDAVTKYFVGKSPSDSLSIENFDCGAVLNQVGGSLTLQTDKELYLVGDSVNVTTVPARTVMPYLVGITTGGWLRKIEGTATGQILVWDEPNGWWEIGSAPGGGTVTGTGAANRVAYWTGTSAIAADADFAFDGSYVGIGTTTLTARLNVNENASLSSPFVANFYAASTTGGNAFITVANTTTTGTARIGLGQSALGSYSAAITRYGSTHTSRAKELNIGTFEASAPLTFTMNTTVRMTVASDANVYVANNIYAGAGTTVTGAHSTVQSGGSFAGAFLESVTTPTFDDSKHVVVYTGTTNVTWTLPTASTCTGRYYWLHHANTTGTVTLSQSITKGNGGNFNTITAGQWAFIVSTGSGWRGFKIASL